MTKAQEQKRSRIEKAERVLVEAAMEWRALKLPLVAVTLACDNLKAVRES